ncbi:MAG: 2-C-methyl-D-erythritol 4-phosphate cytidylyltransferase [Actinobacteria bacterium]|nr:2-C-methyl-D-erythritol 4-phosphate cytidylyltransferase [Actinomycetota bacterium]
MTVAAIVVAGGRGERFGGQKQFAKLGGRTLAAHSVEQSRSVADFVVVVVPEDYVGVQDAARPLASTKLFEAVLAAVRAGAAAAIPGVTVSDTIKQVADGVVVNTPPRDQLVAVQTPQAFQAEVLRRAHASVGVATDDAALVEALGESVVVVAGERTNIKVTNPEDLDGLKMSVA